MTKQNESRRIKAAKNEAQKAKLEAAQAQEIASAATVELARFTDVFGGGDATKAQEVIGAFADRQQALEDERAIFLATVDKHTALVELESKQRKEKQEDLEAYEDRLERQEKHLDQIRAEFVDQKQALKVERAQLDAAYQALEEKEVDLARREQETDVRRLRNRLQGKSKEIEDLKAQVRFLIHEDRLDGLASRDKEIEALKQANAKLTGMIGELESQSKRLQGAYQAVVKLLENFQQQAGDGVIKVQVKGGEIRSAQQPA